MHLRFLVGLTTAVEVPFMDSWIISSTISSTYRKMYHLEAVIGYGMVLYGMVYHSLDNTQYCIILKYCNSVTVILKAPSYCRRQRLSIGLQVERLA